jgi:hypothetical protein
MADDHYEPETEEDELNEIADEFFEWSREMPSYWPY